MSSGAAEQQHDAAEHPARRIRLGVPRLPPGAVRRERLSTRLARQVPLTVLRAPCGFGKTVAVAQWLGSRSGPDGIAVWVRVDPDLGPAGFWAELAGLLSEAGIIITPSSSPTHRVVESCLRRAETPVTIVADGFDELSDRSVQDQLTDLARYCPDVRIVVCLRSSRYFPDSIRVDIDSTIIESPELAFTVAEIAALPPEVSPLPEGWAFAVHRCTAGWPEPTRSVLLALQDDPHQSVDEAARVVAREFLATRVLPYFHQESWLQFALTTSMPESLTEEVAEYLTGDDTAAKRLERLESAGVVTAEQHRGTRIYRWPDAARHALREEFANRNPKAVRSVHQQLAQWYLRQSDARSAVRHALQLADAALLTRIVEDCWGALLHDDVAALDAALAAIPMEEILRSPRATAARDVRMHIVGEVTDAAVLTLTDPLPTSKRALTALADLPDARAAMHTAVSMMTATRMRGMAVPALDYARRAETIGRHAIARRPSDLMAVFPSGMLQVGITRLIFDDVPGAESTLRLAHQTAGSETHGFVKRDAAGKLALLYAVQGDPGRSESWLTRHRATAARPGTLTPGVERSALLARAFAAIDRLRPDEAASAMSAIDRDVTEEQNWRPFSTYLHARYALLWGDRRVALHALDEDMQRLAPWLEPASTIRPLLAAARVDLLLALGLGGLARSALQAHQQHPALRAAAARVALLTGDDATVQQVMVHDPSGPPGARSELLLLSAIRRLRRGDAAGALDLLVEAVGIARATRSLFPFITVPRTDLRRLAQSSPEALALLDSEPLRSAPSPFAPQVSVVELTDRERMVLDRIADGGTLQEIARELFVSHNTVKTQVRSLYAKLGVSSRADALISAARNGLLPAARAASY